MKISTNPVTVVKKTVPSVQKAMGALVDMERELGHAKTYEQIRKIERRAEALHVLYAEVDEVRRECEVVILLANKLIGHELEAIPKASGRPAKKVSSKERIKSGRQDTGLPKARRSRQKKLIPLSNEEVRTVAKTIQDSGKEATLTAFVQVLNENKIKKTRQDYEARAQHGAQVSDLFTLIETGQKFPIIYADPAWTLHKAYSEKGRLRSSPQRHYDCMSLEEIKALPVAQLAADDCALFLWCVTPELLGALEVITAWSFKYKKDGFIWVKTNKHAEVVTLSGEGLHWGMGEYTRNNAEICLLATRGKPKRMAKDVHQIIMAPVGEHSAKPDEARRRIERLYNGPYLELFARNGIEGWTTWGNEIDVMEAAE